MRIVIISPNIKTRTSLRRALEENACAIDTEKDFGKGLLAACANSYHLTVIEHVFPTLDAHALCKELRERGRAFPILVLTPGLDRTLGTRCLDAGADDFMAAPISISEFLARVRSLLRRPYPIRVEEIQIGPITIDRRKQIVKHNKRHVSLSRMQYAVLEVLVIHQGGIVSKTEIIDHVWGDSESSFVEGSLDTHIYMLRRKLERGGRRIIHTEIGRGYRLE